VLKSTTFLTPHKVELAGSKKDSAVRNIGSDGKIATTGNQDAPSDGYTGQASSYLSKTHRSI